MRFQGEARGMGMDPEKFIRSTINYLDVLRALDEGVIITDAGGRIMFINAAQAAIDGVDQRLPIGRTPAEYWDVTRQTSPILQCLATREPILNRHMIYETRMGRRANTINSVFPLWDAAGEMIGSISFVREYNMMEETIASICAVPQAAATRDQGNGTRYRFSDIIGSGTAIQESLRIAKMAASSPSPVMIHGQTGTGKELFAQSIHNFSHRQARTFVGINCAAIPENLLEGVLFGTARGSFTGARDKAGLMEKAHGGTLFLDEVNSMPPGLQVKLLRVIQEKKVRRVGSLNERPVDLKVLSSVNEDPHQAIEGGRLRIDLFYRLGVVMLHIPPLAQRREDIPALTEHFIARCDARLGRNTAGISARVAALFRSYHWPGNVRELEHAIEGALNLLGHRTMVRLADLPRHIAAVGTGAAPGRVAHTATPPGLQPAGLAPPPPPRPSETPPQPSGDPKDLRAAQDDLERRSIVRALKATRGNVTKAGKLLGLSRQRLSYRMKKHGLAREDYAVG